MKKDKKIWDEMAKSFHHLSSRSKAHRNKYKEIAELIISTSPRSILDLGCGSGLLEVELIKQGFRGKIVAIDASTSMLDIAKTVCGKNVNFINADLDKEISLNEKQDVIIAINVLFFLKDKEKFLKNVCQLLRSKSSLLIIVNPKPEHEANNWQFIKAHFSDTSFFEKILIFFNELINLPRYYKMIKGQSNLSKMARNGQIVFDDKEAIKKFADISGLRVDIVRDIHAGQNWLFIMRSK